MRNMLDELRLRIDYMVESVKLRYYVDRDDPLVDHRRRRIVAGIAAGVVLIGAGLVYVLHQVEYVESPISEPSQAQSLNSPLPSTTSTTMAPVAEEPSIPAPLPARTAPAPTTSPAPPNAAPLPATCNPNYSPCVPNAAYDLNCPDVGFSVRVIGSDVYGLDNDGDGTGCDSY